MARWNKNQITIEYPVEYKPGKEIVFKATATAIPYVPARINPVDSSHDAEGGYVENITLMLNGKEIDVDEAAKKYKFKVADLEEKLYSAWCDQDPDFNED